MLRAALERRGDREDLGGAPRRLRLDRIDAELAGGQRAGLVEDEEVGAAEGLDGVAAGREEPAPRQRPARGGERHRRRQRERAGAGDDEHRDHRRQHPLGVGPGPVEADARREHQDAAHEPLRGAVGDARDLRFRGHRLLDQPQQGRQHRALADRRDSHDERAFDVDRAADDALAGRPRHRHALAGEQRLVERRQALLDHAVGRHALAGEDPHPVADRELDRGDDRLAAIRASGTGGGVLRSQPPGGRRNAAHHRLLLAHGAFARHQLEDAGTEQEEDEHHDRVEVDLAAVGDRRPHAAEIGERQPEGDRHVHADAAVGRSFQAPAKNGRAE